jgi:hypothetical protein
LLAGTLEEAETQLASCEAVVSIGLSYPGRSAEQVIFANIIESDHQVRFWRQLPKTFDPTISVCYDTYLKPSGVPRDLWGCSLK